MIQREKLKIEIEITMSRAEKKINGITTVYGICTATGEENSITFGFVYAGKTSEKIEKLYEYLEDKANNIIYNNEEQEQEETLGDFINKEQKRKEEHLIDDIR